MATPERSPGANVSQPSGIEIRDAVREKLKLNRHATVRNLMKAGPGASESVIVVVNGRKFKVRVVPSE